VCVCEGSFKEEEKGAGFIIPMADMICSMALGETHTALLLCARSGRESLFSFKGRKKRTKNTWHQTVGARLEGITIRYYLCSLLLPFKTFFFHHSSSLLISTGLTGISFSLLLTVF
jgi:hypothetical protein